MYQPLNDAGLKLFIDSKEARISSVGDFYQSPTVDGTFIHLPLNVESQQMSRWCWAALACAVARYFNTASLTQGQLVQSLLDSDGTYTQKSEELNQNFKLDHALKQVHCFSHWSPGKPGFERIQFEINQGRPIGIRLEWYRSKEAHYVLIKGYDIREGTVAIEDSENGPSIQNYKNFPEDYGTRGAVWTETFWTNKKSKPNNSYHK